jgi:predicted ester cyclase
MASEPEREAERNARRVARVNEHMRLENAHDFPGCIAEFQRPRYEFVATGEVHDGSAGVESLLLENRRAFPDFRFEPRRTSAGGDVVLVEGEFTGTQEGPWRGLPPTGRRVRLPMAVVFEFEGESLVCERVYFDLGTVLRQLGVARDPLTLSGRLATVVGHPVTIARALLRSLFRRRTRPPATPPP